MYSKLKCMLTSQISQTSLFPNRLGGKDEVKGQRLTVKVIQRPFQAGLGLLDGNCLHQRLTSPPKQVPNWEIRKSNMWDE